MTTKEYQSWMAGWMEYRKDIYSYNTSGQQIHDSVCYWDNIALIYKSAGQKFYTYDTHGNQIEILIQNWNFLDTTQTITSQIRYNYFYSCTTSTVSVEENQFQNTEVKVYPNPANTEIYFAVPNETNFDVEIYNTLGQMVLSEKNHSQTQAFNVSLLSKGLYQLKITTPKHSYFSKVVKN